MKEIELNGITYIEAISGTNEWYWGIDSTGGDLYEAQELFQNGEIEGNHLYIIHYPDGKVYHNTSLEGKGRYFGKPVYYENTVVMLMVDFVKEVICIFRLEAEQNKIEKIVELPLAVVEDCYNLQLDTSPLMLTRQSNDEYFEVIYPKKAKFSIEKRESFYFAEGNKLYFNVWYEEPEYREEMVVRLLPEGNIIERFSGDIYIMPNGEKWHLK